MPATPPTAIELRCTVSKAPGKWLLAAVVLRENIVLLAPCGAGTKDDCTATAAGQAPSAQVPSLHVWARLPSGSRSPCGNPLGASAADDGSVLDASGFVTSYDYWPSRPP